MNRKIFFHPERCILCHSCVLACEMDSLGISQVNEIPVDKVPRRRIGVTLSQGTPWVWKCQQCVSAPCVEACVSGSLTPMEGKEGVVHHSETCVGCGSCILACPYDALKHDEKEGRVAKCNLCLEKETPPCVEACHSKALVFQELNSFIQSKRRRMVQQMGEFHEET